MATDERITAVKTDAENALKDIDDIYGVQNEDGAWSGGLIEEASDLYQDAINKVGVRDEKGNWNEGSWADSQTKIQNESTELMIDQIEQQKDQAGKDYVKEQSAAYEDYQKQIDPYGVNAEKMAGAGMAGTGYSESSKVRMYNTYQNRVAVARESFKQAVLNYDNAIKEAQLQNSSALAEIAYQALTQTLSLSLEGFQYKNELIAEKTAAQNSVKAQAWSNYMDVLDQINAESAITEDGSIKGESTIEQTADDTAYTIDDIKTKAAQLGNADLASWLDQLTAEGHISEDEADALFAEYKKITNETQWIPVSDGGLNNIFTKVDSNAKVKDEYGEEYTFSEIQKILKKQGWTSEQARNYVLHLQSKFGF